jgi:cytochrome c biogenesis protein CcmG/thiol:disulfide interchange protein DsbE
VICAVLRRFILALAALLLPLLFTACNTGNASLGLLGKPAPALNLPGHPLASLHGHPVVLNFWASWCAPCLLEFPSLEALQQQLPGVTVLAVSFDRDPQAYARFLRQHHITVRTALDTTGRSNTAYGTSEPPETYILDSSGVVRRRFIGAQDWTDPEIESYLRALE